MSKLSKATQIKRYESMTINPSNIVVSISTIGETFIDLFGIPKEQYEKVKKLCKTEHKEYSMTKAFSFSKARDKSQVTLFCKV